MDRTNTIKGFEGQDLIFGDTGNDTLGGGANVDRLTGGIGRDVMTGGSERDVFDFNDATGVDRQPSNLPAAFLQMLA